jgi:parallel beta-helix repeat protein
MKKHHITLILFFLILILNFFLNKPVKVIYVKTSYHLEKIFRKTQKSLNVRLVSGRYNLSAVPFIDSTCGNCQEPDTPVSATYGLKISGKNITISGPEDHSAVIYTNAGYGLYIKDCERCLLENLTITGGIRDSAAFASDAAIVVSNSEVTIRNNIITRNLGDSLMIAKNISGIMGICGRENSVLTIINNEISGNSWDGIALYRDSEAVIEENIIDGIDKARGNIPGGGRGVAIGVTWNAKARIANNLIRRYWKGIGIFVDAQVTVRSNILEDLITWGIALWDADKGEPIAEISNNIIYNTGAMGASITSNTEENPGYFSGNIIVQTAQDSVYDSPDYYGYQCALAEHSIPENFVIENNLFYENRRATDDLPEYDIGVSRFFKELRLRKEWIKKIPVLEDSEFYQEFM